MKVGKRREQLNERRIAWNNLKGDGFKRRGRGGYKQPGALKHY